MDFTVFNNDLPDNLQVVGDIAIDTETMGLNLQRDRLCLIQLSTENKQVYIIKFTNTQYNTPNLKNLLLDESRTKIFHFARFDLAAIKLYLKISCSNIFCTKIASKLVRTYTEFHGLKELCKELLHTQISKQQQSSDWGNSTLTQEQVNYAASDVLYLHQLKKILTDMLIRENRLILAQQIFNFLPIRVDLDLLGWNNIDIFEH